METVLKTVELGRTELQISCVGLGAWAIGGAGWWDAWGAEDDEESIATIRRAAELGINWVDTAPSYGLGHSEEVVGRARGPRPAAVRVDQGRARIEAEILPFARDAGIGVVVYSPHDIETIHDH